MNELALFAGAGGSVLAGCLLGWRTVCAVEIDAYARSVLLARQRDGILEPFPIWDDVKTFDGSLWRGSVDVVSGGFPCQDIAVGSATKTGLSGERSCLWFEMLRIIGEVRPRYVFLENSAALVVRGLSDICGQLASLGYDSTWGTFSAADVGAPHERKRLFCVASRYGIVCRPGVWVELQRGELEDEIINRETCEADAERAFLEMAKEHARMDDGLAYPVDAVRAIGNGQVPAVVKLAWNLLNPQ